MQYYVRQGPSDSIRGPFTLSEIRQMLTQGTLTGAAQAVQATGQSLFQLRASNEWSDVHALVGASRADASAVTDVAPSVTTRPKSRQERLMYGLLAAGVALVVLAHPVAKLLVPSYSFGNGQGWDARQLADMTSQVRLLGMMSFAAGLVERLALAIRPRS